MDRVKFLDEYYRLSAIARKIANAKRQADWSLDYGYDDPAFSPEGAVFHYMGNSYGDYSQEKEIISWNEIDHPDEVIQLAKEKTTRQEKERKAAQVQREREQYEELKKKFNP